MTTNRPRPPKEALVIATLRGVPLVIMGKPSPPKSQEEALVSQAIETRGPVELQTKFDFKGEK